MRREDLRNVAIIAHVDHGKTTLVDAMLFQAGALAAHGERSDRMMDSMDLERERGITILSKNTSVRWGEIRVNLIDTPGHADFGAEVERILRLADGVLLLVDAAEGPMPQTRFVLSKALALGLAPVVVINKIDRPDQRAAEALDEIYDLFIELDADEDQLDFPVLYAVGRDGICRLDPEDDGNDLRPLFEAIIEHVPPPLADPDSPLQLLITTLDADEFVGRLGIGRLVAGSIRRGQQVARISIEGELETARVRQLFGFEGLHRIPIDAAAAGDLIAVAGLENLELGDTLADPENPVALPKLKIDEPTLAIEIRANDSPFSGREGKFVTQTKIRERLEREALGNPAIKLEAGDKIEVLRVLGRGELQLAILMETMRREGYEIAVGTPQVVTREIDGKLHEPMEQLFIDVPEQYLGPLTQILAPRRGHLEDTRTLGSGRLRLTFRVPSRGLIGVRTELLTSTRGTAVFSSLFAGWAPWKGDIERIPHGALISDRTGKVTTHAIENLQARGQLYVTATEEVYQGMIIGEHNRSTDLDVNICREKKLNNIRSSTAEISEKVNAAKKLSLDAALEILKDDELLEITPAGFRLRKRILNPSFRK